MAIGRLQLVESDDESQYLPVQANPGGVQVTQLLLLWVSLPPPPIDASSLEPQPLYGLLDSRRRMSMHLIRLLNRHRQV